MFPVIAAGVINQKWIIYVPFFNVNFTSWRLFIVLGSLPGLIGAIAFLYLPESPKYLFSRGKTTEATSVIKTVYGVDQEVSSSTNEPLYVDSNDKSISFLKSLWEQTSPLVKPKYLRTTTIVCMLEFVCMYSAFGMVIWFPDIVNSIMEHVKDERGMASLCEIYGNKFTRNQTGSICIDSFDISTYKYSIILESMYLLSYFITFILSRHISNNNLISEYL